MKDERPELEPADEEELRSAAALARALEGGADVPDVPRAALETAALLRLSAGAAELSDERRHAIKHDLLAGLPARSERRRTHQPEWLRVRRWFSERARQRWAFVALPLAGTAALCLLLLAKGPEPTAPFADRSFVEPQTGAKGRGMAEEPMAASQPMAASEPAAADHGLAATETLSRAEAASGAGAEPESKREAAPSLAAPAAPRDADAYARRKTEALHEFAPGEEARGVGARGTGGPGTVGAASSAGLARSQALRADEMLADEKRGGAAPVVGNLAGAVRQPSARAALVGLDKEVRAERTQLLARSNDAELSRAHAELDGASSRTELQRSQAGLSRLLDTAGDGLGPSDARHVRQDLYCRLAETALRLGEPRSALEWTRRGIELDGPPSPFLAQLMALEGDALGALGDPSGAAASYMKALRVHEALLDESLDGR